MASRDDIDLMLLLDGELDDAARAELEAELDGDAEARAKVESLEQVGETVRTYLELQADDAEPALAGLWDGIERQLSSNGVSDHAPAAVVATRGHREARREDGTGFWASVTRWFDNYRGYFMTSAVTAGAVAAVILIFRQPEEKVVQRTVYQPAPAEVMPAANPPTPTAPEVEELDVFGGSGAVLTIPGEDGEADTAVIWITPDESEVEGPI